MTLTIKHRYAYYKRFELDIWGFCKTDLKAGINGYLVKLDAFKKRQETTIYNNRFNKKRNKHLLDQMYKYEFRDQCSINHPTDCYILHNFVLSFFYRLWYEYKLRQRAKRRRYVYRLDIIIQPYKRKRYNKRFISIRVTRLYFLTFQDHQFRKLFKRASKMDGNLQTNYLRLIEGRMVSIIYRTNYVSNLFAAMDFVLNGNVFVEERCINSLNYIVPIGKFMRFCLLYRKRLMYFLKRRIKMRRMLFNIPRYLYMSHRLNYFYLLRLPQRKDLVYPISIDIQRITGYY